VIHRDLPGTMSLCLSGATALQAALPTQGNAYNDVPEQEQSYFCMHQFGQAFLLLV